MSTRLGPWPVLALLLSFVTLGAPAKGLRVVVSGLKNGERVVVNGLQHVRPGALVAPQTVPMDATAQVPAERKVASNS